MHLPRVNLTLALVASFLVAVMSGCTQLRNPALSESKHSHTSSTTPPTTGLPVIPGTGNEPSASDMTGVLDKLAQVRAMDPAAEQKLLAELRRTPANSWPLVAEQFRASLAYHQQLAARQLKTNTTRDPMAAFQSLSTEATAFQESAEVASRLSTAIGALVDPHGVNLRADESVAQSSPLAMPQPNDTVASATPDKAAPAEFVGNGPMYPITNAHASAVAPATFQATVANEASVTSTNLAAAGGIESPSPHKSKPLPNTNANLGQSLTSFNHEGDWQKQVLETAETLSRQVTQSPSTTAEVHQHVSLRVLRLLAGDTERALEPIPHIPPAEQDYWSRQIFAIATYLDHHNQPDDKRRAAASVVHLDEAVSHLRELGSLSLRNLTFCREVYGYGAFEPCDNDVFSAGDQVSLYVEIENYHSESSEKGYCTLLGATYEILNDKGRRVTGGEFPDIDDCCRSRRRDFHIQLGLALPQNLSPGRYRLDVVVKDRQSDKRGHATAPFEIRVGRK